MYKFVLECTYVQIFENIMGFEQTGKSSQRHVSVSDKTRKALRFISPKETTYIHLNFL